MYWFRRVLVFGTLAALLFATWQWLFGNPDEVVYSQPRAESATLAGSPVPKATPRQQAPELGPVAVPQLSPQAEQTPPEESASAETAAPVGPVPVCQARQVLATPHVEAAVAGRPVRVRVGLQALGGACDFQITARTLMLNITSGADRIWSSQHCRQAVIKQKVTLPPAGQVTVELKWNGRRSVPDCAQLGAWATPGTYHATAAAIGSVPSQARFALVAPEPKVIRKKAPANPKRAKPKRAQKKQAQRNRTASETPEPTEQSANQESAEQQPRKNRRAKPQEPEKPAPEDEADSAR